MLLPALFLLLLAGVGAYVFLSRRSASTPVRKATEPSASPAAPTAASKARPHKVDITASKRKLSAATDAASSPDAASTASTAEHPLVSRHLRGHQDDITGLAVSSTGRHVASVARDEQLRLWTIPPQGTVGGSIPFARHNLAKGSYGSAVHISSDDKYVIMATHSDKQFGIEIFGITSKDESASKAGDKSSSSGAAAAQHAYLQPLHRFPTPHRSPITTVRMSSNSSIIVTLARGSIDLTVHIFSPKGALLQSIAVNQLQNFHFALSDDSRFLAIATKLDSKVFELHYSKTAKGLSSSSSSAPSFERAELITTLGKSAGGKSGVRQIAFGSPAAGILVAAALDGSFAEHSLSGLMSAGGSRDTELRLRARTHTEFAAAGGGAGGIDLLDVLPAADEQQARDEAPLLALSAGQTLQFWRGTMPQQRSGAGAGAAAAEARMIASIPHAHRSPIAALAFNRASADATAASAHPVLATAGAKTITLWNLPA